MPRRILKSLLTNGWRPLDKIWEQEVEVSAPLPEIAALGGERSRNLVR